MTEGNVGKTEIDDVLLVGGSSHVPKLRQMLTEFFGKELLHVFSVYALSHVQERRQAKQWIAHRGFDLPVYKNKRNRTRMHHE